MQAVQVLWITSIASTASGPAPTPQSSLNVHLPFRKFCALYSFIGPQCHAAAHLSGPRWFLGPAAALHWWRHSEVWPAATDQEQQLEACRQPWEEGKGFNPSPTVTYIDKLQWHSTDSNEQLSLNQGQLSFKGFKVWWHQKWIFPFFPPTTISQAPSSCTKEDSSTEERNYTGEISGPAGQTPTRGSTAAHGGQAGSLVPTELSVGASRQHRDLYSRGSD